MSRRSTAAARLAAMATVARWLGPWSPATAAPVVPKRELTLGRERLVRAHLYEPPRGRAIGAYLVAQGLHHLGPDDPRMERFCRVLARSGLIVLAPFLADYLALRIAPTATTDLITSFEHLDRLACDRALPPPAVFSISFGSSPAIQLAAHPDHGDRVGALVLFGGFADFFASVRYAVTGPERDPLNSPVVFMNLLEHADLQIDRGRVLGAWRTMVERTWGRMELKRAGARDPIAAAIAAELPPRERELFLLGCGLAPGGPELLEAALARAGRAFDHFDPRTHLARVRAPVLVVHGRNDDVIPWREAEKIRRALPEGHPCRVILTGMWGHTGSELPRAADIARELAAMVEMVGAVVNAATGAL